MIGAVINDDTNKNSFQIHFKYKTFAIRNQYGADHTLDNLFTQKKISSDAKEELRSSFLVKKGRALLFGSTWHKVPKTPIPSIIFFCEIL